MRFTQFEFQLETRCKEFPKRVILPESRDLRILEAAVYLAKVHAVERVFLFLTESEFFSLAPQADRALLGRLAFLPEPDPSQAPLPHLATLYGAAQLLKEGKAEAVVSGAVFTTAEVLRAGLKVLGCAEGIKTVSGSFFMVREHAGKNPQVYLYADCGVVVDPSSEQLADIATASLRTWQAVRGPAEPPCVAFLSFSTKGSASHPMVEKVVRACELFRARHPDIACDGEMQFDAAFSAEVGQRKCPGSPVPGRANICIFPNLDAGNIAYKITQRLGGFDAYGPILQGFSRPYSDLSRGASAKDVVVSAYINLL